MSLISLICKDERRRFCLHLRSWADKMFVWVKARVEGDSAVVNSSQWVAPGRSAMLGRIILKAAIFTMRQVCRRHLFARTPFENH